jgi:hypothetical protein
MPPKQFDKYALPAPCRIIHRIPQQQHKQHRWSPSSSRKPHRNSRLFSMKITTAAALSLLFSATPITADIRGSKATQRSAALSDLLDADAPMAEGSAIAAEAGSKSSKAAPTGSPREQTPAPSTADPSTSPSSSPTISFQPTSQPSLTPSVSAQPSLAPSKSGKSSPRSRRYD